MRSTTCWNTTLYFLFFRSRVHLRGLHNSNTVLQMLYLKFWLKNVLKFLEKIIPNCMLANGRLLKVEKRILVSSSWILQNKDNFLAFIDFYLLIWAFYLSLTFWRQENKLWSARWTQLDSVKVIPLVRCSKPFFTIFCLLSLHLKKNLFELLGCNDVLFA